MENPTKHVIDRRLMLEALLTCSAECKTSDNTVIFWVFRDYHDQWCVRKEGGEIEASFSSRKDAMGFARKTAEAWGSYTLYIQLKDGRITKELCNLACL